MSQENVADSDVGDTEVINTMTDTPQFDQEPPNEVNMVLEPVSTLPKDEVDEKDNSSTADKKQTRRKDTPNSISKQERPKPRNRDYAREAEKRRQTRAEQKKAQILEEAEKLLASRMPQRRENVESSPDQPNMPKLQFQIEQYHTTKEEMVNEPSQPLHHQLLPLQLPKESVLKEGRSEQRTTLELLHAALKATRDKVRQQQQLVREENMMIQQQQTLNSNNSWMKPQAAVITQHPQIVSSPQMHPYSSTKGISSLVSRWDNNATESRQSTIPIAQSLKSNFIRRF